LFVVYGLWLKVVEPNLRKSAVSICENLREKMRFGDREKKELHSFVAFFLSFLLQ
jgi:hypothetical protein